MIKNKYMVGVQGDMVVVGNPPRVPMTADDAMCFAAYLLTMAEGNAEREWEEVLCLVQD